jgi:DtxR family Mn-dependent transcriptional regulator
MSEQKSPEYSKAVEDFLKAVYVLQQGDERVSTNTLSEALTISAPSVTDMAQRMVKDGLVDYQKYRGVILTAAGVEIALRMLRRHRLIELYLVRELGYALHEVHHEAEALEHAVTDRFVEAIAQKLGDPDVDPHGDPIPTAEGRLTERDLKPLTEWALHTPGHVARLRSESAELLQHILERDFRLGARIEVTGRDPFDGPLTVMVDGSERVIGHTAAESIMIEESSQDEQESTT